MELWFTSLLPLDRVRPGAALFPTTTSIRQGWDTPALKQNYDKSALLDPRWAEKTLCGRVWVSMAATPPSSAGTAPVTSPYMVRALVTVAVSALTTTTSVACSSAPIDRVNAAVDAVPEEGVKQCVDKAVTRGRTAPVCASAA